MIKIRLIMKFTMKRIIFLRSNFFSGEKKYLSNWGIRLSNIKNMKVIETTVAKNNVAFPTFGSGIRLNNAINNENNKKAIV